MAKTMPAPRAICIALAVGHLSYYKRGLHHLMCVCRRKEVDLAALKKDILLFAKVYLAEITLALLGYSTLWSWKAKDVVFHHTAAIYASVLTIVYNRTMLAWRPERPPDVNLIAMVPLWISVLLSGQNETLMAAMTAIRPPNMLLQRLRRRTGLVTNLLLFAGEFLSFTKLCVLFSRTRELMDMAFAAHVILPFYIRSGFLLGYYKLFLRGGL